MWVQLIKLYASMRNNALKFCVSAIRSTPVATATGDFRLPEAVSILCFVQKYMCIIIYLCIFITIMITTLFIYTRILFCIFIFFIIFLNPPLSLSQAYCALGSMSQMLSTANMVQVALLVEECTLPNIDKYHPMLAARVMWFLGEVFPIDIQDMIFNFFFFISHIYICVH